MSYRVDYGELDALLGAYNNAISQWRSGITSVMGQAGAIKASANISGNSADRMRDYLDMTYSCVNAMLSTLLDLFQQSFLLYTEAYHQQVDASGETHIDEEELSERRNGLQGKRSQLQQIALSVENTAGKVSDLVALPSLDIGEVDARIGAISTSLDNLDSAVNSVESAYTSGGITEINELLSNARAFLLELCQQSAEFKTAFTATSFVALASVPRLLSSMNNAYAQLSAQESDVAVAVSNLEKRLELQQAEYEKRQEQVKWAKAAVTILTTAASAAAVATGVGTLLVPVICYVGKSAFNAAADEYALHGWNTVQWDTALIGKEAIKGWFTGFTCGILPPGTGDVVKASLSSANSALWGGLDNAYDQMVTTGTISDTNSIFFDAAKSGTSNLAGEFAGNMVGDKVKNLPIGLGLDKYTAPSDEFKHYAGIFVQGGTEKVTSGIAERFTSTTVETGFDACRNAVEGKGALDSIDFADRYKNVLSLEEIGEDFVKGGTKEIASTYHKEHTPDPKTGLSPVVQSKLEQIEKENGSFDHESGLSPIVQAGLEDMEKKNPSTGGYLHTPEFGRTSSNPLEEKQIREMDINGEFDVSPSDYGSSHFSSDMKPLTEEPIKIEFIANVDKYSEAGFADQLSGQEEGLNYTTVADALDQMEEYREHGRTDSSNYQNNYRIGVIETIVDESGEKEISQMMKKDPHLSYEQASEKVNWEKLRREAEKEVEHYDALHDPDQNAGGNPSNIHSIDSSSINRSIGSQWGHGRADELYERIKDASEGMTREEMERTMLNIRLDYSVTDNN